MLFNQKLRNFCFLLSLFFLFSSFVLFRVYGISNLKTYSRLLASVFAILSFIFSDAVLNYKVILLSVYSIASLVMSMGASLNMSWILTVGLLLCMTKRELLFRTVENINYLLLLILLVGYLTGYLSLTQNVVGARVRSTLGDTGPNGIAMFINSIFICNCLFKKSIKSMVVCMCIAFIIYILTDSRTIFLTSVIFLTVVLFSQALNYYNLNIKIILFYIILTTLVFLSPLVIGYLYINYSYLDELLSYRLYCFSSFMDLQNLYTMLFGGAETVDFPVDNSYLLILFNCGLSAYLLWYYLLIKSIIYTCVNKLPYELAYLLSFTFFCCFESAILRPELSFALVYWYILFNDTLFTEKPVLVEDQYSTVGKVGGEC